jgi:hypothetical protein
VLLIVSCGRHSAPGRNLRDQPQKNIALALPEIVKSFLAAFSWPALIPSSEPAPTGQIK